MGFCIVKNLMDCWIRVFGGFGGLGLVVGDMMGVRVVIRTACLVIGMNVWMLWSGGICCSCLRSLRFCFLLLVGWSFTFDEFTDV
jgi:hypothetical protein